MTAQQTILVVEDDDDIREAIQDALENEGYRVATAVDGQDGLRCLHEIENPCLILLDLMMPVMSGGEFLVALRDSTGYAEIPVVIASAWPDAAAEVRERAQGFVKKPIALGALLEAVSGWCSGESHPDRETPP
jgi:two-component system chemotaxis response regulator CheY